MPRRIALESAFRLSPPQPVTIKTSTNQQRVLVSDSNRQSALQRPAPLARFAGPGIVSVLMLICLLIMQLEFRLLIFDFKTASTQKQDG
jgi:hypothetical protein